MTEVQEKGRGHLLKLLGSWNYRILVIWNSILRKLKNLGLIELLQKRLTSHTQNE